jgi:hypothetical protein
MRRRLSVCVRCAWGGAPLSGSLDSGRMRVESIGMAQLACIGLRQRNRRTDCVTDGGQTHRRYTRRINFREGWHAHLVLRGGHAVQQGLEGRILDPDAFAARQADQAQNRRSEERDSCRKTIP